MEWGGGKGEEEEGEVGEELVHYCTLSLSDIWVTRQIIITNVNSQNKDYLDGCGPQGRKEG